MNLSAVFGMLCSSIWSRVIAFRSCRMTRLYKRVVLASSRPTLVKPFGWPGGVTNELTWSQINSETPHSSLLTPLIDNSCKAGLIDEQWRIMVLGSEARGRRLPPFPSSPPFFLSFPVPPFSSSPSLSLPFLFPAPSHILLLFSYTAYYCIGLNQS